MRVNIARAELQRGKGKKRQFSSQGHIRLKPTQGAQLPAFLLFFGLQKWRKIQGTYLGKVLDLPRLISPATIFSKLQLSSSSYK
jgi:hypothetical protein